MKQAIPPSVTGKGAAYAGSVLDHAFGASDPYTLGVEEEYMLLDPETFDLVQHVDTVLAAMSGGELEPHARELGSERELEGVQEILARGNSADRQLRIFNANRDIAEVAQEIAAATEVAAA